MVVRRPCADAAAVEPSALERKRAVPARGRGGGVGRVAFAIGGMSSAARRRLAARFESELASVRALLKKAAGFLPAPGAGKSVQRADSSSSSPAKRKDGRFLATGAAAGVRSGGGAPVKKRKACFFLEKEDAPKKKRTPEWPDVGKRVLATAAAREAASLSAELPTQIGNGELLRRNRHGAKIDKLQLTKCTEETRNHRHEPPMDASAVIHPSPSPRHRQADGKTGVEKEDDVDICRGASARPTAPSPLLPDDVDYGELVGATGVDMLSPPQRKYIALAERADVCDGGGGGASTVAPALSPLLPPEYGEFVGATGVDLLSPQPRKHVVLAERVDAGVAPTPAASLSLPPGYSELITDAAGVVEMLSPLPREHVALAERVGVDVSPAATIPGYSELAADATGVKMLSLLPHKYVTLAPEDDDEYVNICGDASPVLIKKINHGEIVSISSNSSSPSSSDSDSTSSDSDSEASAAVAAAACSTPTPAIPTNAQPSSEPPAPPKLPQSATKQEEKLPDHGASAAAVAATTTASAKLLTNLIARAQGAVSRRRQEAREKARQELQEMEIRTTAAAAMASNAVHPLDMELLGLAAVEHMVSSDVDEVRRALSFGSAALRAAAPSWPSLVEKLGLFLKSDGGSDKEDQQRLPPAPSFAGGVDDDVEEGEIR